jgi:hypothetical protein
MADKNLGRYLRLYGLHLVEHSVSHEMVLRVRVAATQYVTSIMPANLDQLWLKDPRAGVEMAEDLVLPKIEALQRDPDAWEALGLDRPDPRFEEYQQERGAGNLKSQIAKALPNPAKALVPRPSNLGTIPLNRNFERVNQMLQVAQTAIVVADAARRFWQDWRIGQEKLKVVEARRLLLEDALRATSASQNHALQQALDPSFVENYLGGGGNDPAYDILFGEIEDEDE